MADCSRACNCNIDINLKFKTMTKKELKKLRLKIRNDKSITGISYNPLTIIPEPKIVLIREIKNGKV